MGKLFVFEGPDGVGKSTLAKGLGDYFRSNGVPYNEFSFPGREEGTLGKHVYHLHHNWRKLGIQSLNPASLQILHVAAHVDTIDGRIIPAIEAGRHVILDRFWWSTWVYGIVSGVAPESVKTMVNVEMVHWGKVLPDALFLVQNEAPHREDVRDNAWHAILSAYRDLAQKEKRRCPVYCVESSGSVDDTIKRIIRIVEGLR